MPSPFPGMDPFIEGQKWAGFHTQFVTALGQSLIPALRPRYVVDIEDYVYLTRGEDEPALPIGPDVSVSDTGHGRASAATVRELALAPPPVVRTVPISRRRRQHHLTIRNRQSLNVVTTIELLFPWNKSPGDGREEYLNKRQNVFASGANLVELDLLRGGARLPTREPLAAGDYFAFVCRAPRLPKVEVYALTLRDPMPPVPVPLAAGDADASMRLRAVFSEMYDRAGYDYALEYARPLVPSPGRRDKEWVNERVKSAAERPK